MPSFSNRNTVRHQKSIPVNTRILALLVLAILIITPQFGQGAAAESLLHSPRQFLHDGGLRAMTLQLEDVTGDGRADVIMPHELFSGGDGGSGSLVEVRPGLEDGTVGEPILTYSTFGTGRTWESVVAEVNGDAHPDLLLNVKPTYEDYGRVIVLTGDGTGSYAVSDNIELGHLSQRIVAADFTGDGEIDFMVNVYGEPGPYYAHLYQGAGDGTFTEQGTTGTSERFDFMAAGDIDGDGDMDAVISGYYQPVFTLLVNDGTGSFTAVEYAVPSWIAPFAVGDLNDDGLDDLVAACYEDGEVLFFFGNPDGTLSENAQIDIGGPTTYIALGDLDNDGDLDLAANTNLPGYYQIERVAVLENDGTGNFYQPKYSFRHGYNIALGDIDGDGNLDAAMYGTLECFSILLGKGNGEFVTMTDLVIDLYSYDVSCTDVDLDGDPDIVASNSSQGLLVLLNNGDGTYADPAPYGDGSQALFGGTGDLDGDGYPEIFFTNVDQHTLVIFRNNGDGTFQFQQTISLEYSPGDMCAGDLDADGDLDITVLYSNQLGVLINPGDGNFQNLSTYTVTHAHVNLALGDADGDGDLDAVIITESNPGLSLMRNDGHGVFSAPESQGGLYGRPSALVMADLDEDGDLDLAVGTYFEDYIALLFNDGTGAFSGDYYDGPMLRFVDDIKVDDLNGDGRVDLVVGTRIDLAFFPGHGDGTFGPPEQYFADDIETLDLADCDGNGSLDVVVCGYADNNLTIYFNTLVTTGLLVTGPGPGEFNPSLVRVYGLAVDRNVTEWHAYGVDRWGVNVALGQLDGVGGPEVLAGAGPGPIFGPHVRGFTIDGTPLPGVSFLAYGTNKWGVNVASGDLDGDGYDEIITGAGPGEVFGPHVRGWNWDGSGSPQPIPGISYFAYGTPKWGVNVNCGDIDGDGYDEIVTGAGPGAVYGPHVRAWNCDGGGAVAIPQVSFLAYGTNKFGVNVCCGDIDGDGIDEMVTGAGPGAVFGPHVRAWNWDGTGATQSIPAVSYFAYGYTQWGVNVSCSDLDEDGIDEIITGAGPGAGHEPRVRGWNYDGEALTAMTGVDFLAYSPATVTHGVKVAGQR